MGYLIDRKLPFFVAAYRHFGVCFLNQPGFAKAVIADKHTYSCCWSTPLLCSKLLSVLSILKLHFLLR
jgi:hypothetical protein